LTLLPLVHIEEVTGSVPDREPRSESLHGSADSGILGAVIMPMSLTRYGKEVSSVFDLLGRDENDLTAALGFTLARSPRLLHLMLQRLGLHLDDEDVVVRLETRDDHGRTDLEIDSGNHLIIIEAKRGWLVPGETQLTKYAPRVAAYGSGALVSLSAATEQWAGQTLPIAVQGVPVIHLPWEGVRLDLAAARTAVRGRERVWLDEFQDYLRKAIKMRDPADCWTYCVVISNNRPGNGGPRTFRDFVTGEGCYFHPYGWGKGWPRTPPNFLAFRWDGQVQQIHRVTRAEVIPNLQARWPNIPQADDTGRPHAVYYLGPQLPGTPIPNGARYRAQRRWVILDYLLSSPTLREALHQTTLITTGAEPDDPDD
jgi:hypothetical protein